MRNPLERILLVSAILALVLAVGSPPPAAAADRTIALFGDDNAPGWGLDAGNITDPGPHLQVDVGDNVTLMLTGADTTNLRWFIDYDNDSTHDANEPRSPTFDDQPAPVQWNFTADTVGTFTYRDQNHPATMTGLITIRNVTGQPGNPFALDTNLYIVIGLTIGFVALLLVASVYARRKKEQKHPETKETKE